MSHDQSRPETASPSPRRPREEVAIAAADAIEAFGAQRADACPALVGFDGFIDSIISVVHRRATLDMDDYEPVRTIPDFAARVGSAAGKSANIELVVREQRFGGNGPLMAGALGRLGLPTTYVGAVGSEEDHTALHPIFAPFAERCAEVLCVAPPALTDALEFDDGKLMLGKTANVQIPTWDHLKRSIGLGRLREIVAASSLLGIVNWVMMGGVEGIWRGLMDEVLPALGDDGRSRRVFIDLADPAKRTDEDIARALACIRELDAVVPVTLGLNLSESQRVARVCGAAPFDDVHNVGMARAVRETAVSIRGAIDIDCVVVHPRQGAAASNRAGATAWFEGPFTSSPRLSTGAGDHFNGGFSFAQVAGLPLDECLAVGCGVSGAYVRDAMSPNLARLVEFLRDMPEAD